MKQIKAFLKDERGVGVVEVILILVVLVALVAIFKTRLTFLVQRIFSSIEIEVGSLF